MIRRRPRLINDMGAELVLKRGQDFGFKIAPKQAEQVNTVGEAIKRINKQKGEQ